MVWKKFPQMDCDTGEFLLQWVQSLYEIEGEEMRILTRDRGFYSTLGHLMLTIVLQNVIAYSVNMADNIMLGAYSQNALAGAATVNQLQFLLQQLTIATADSLVVLASQYWGTRKTGPIRRITGLALVFGAALGGVFFLAASLCPEGILRIFTSDAGILQEGLTYLRLMRFTYPLYVLSAVLMASLRSVETVKIAFYLSVTSLLVNVGINYTLIYGRFGFPTMGIRGAAIGTLVARGLELTILLCYMVCRDEKLRLFAGNPWRGCLGYGLDFWKIYWPSFCSQLLWGLSIPIQTAILGHLSADAIAANSVSTTLFQYLKVITVGEASASAVLIGRTLGEGSRERAKEYSRSLQVLFLLVALLLGLALFLIRTPLLSLYALNDNTRQMANQIMLVLCVVIVGMGYQMPTGVGIVKGGGDVKFMMYLNMISTWLIVMPISFAAAFWWKLPVAAVVLCLNADQLFKCVPCALRANGDKWMRKLTRD